MCKQLQHLVSLNSVRCSFRQQISERAAAFSAILSSKVDNKLLARVG